jgi:hypothetical protein
MQAAHLGPTNDGTERRKRDGATFQRILLKS